MTALLEYIDLFIKVGFFKVNSAKNLCGHCRLGRTPSYGPAYKIIIAMAAHNSEPDYRPPRLAVSYGQTVYFSLGAPYQKKNKQSGHARLHDYKPRSVRIILNYIASYTMQYAHSMLI